MAAGVDGYNFTLIDKKTIEYLQGLKKTVNVAKDYSWNNKLIGAELLQGVLGGESIPKIAGRLRNVEAKMERSAVKNARTMTTAAQNRGRLDGMAQAQADGVIMQKMWVATHDGRTRDSHAEIDGEQQDQDDAFTNGLMFPGDPAGEASLIYNCRCTMISVVKGFRSDDGTVFGVDTSLDDYTDEAQAYWGNKEQEAEQKAQKGEGFIEYVSPFTGEVIQIQKSDFAQAVGVVGEDYINEWQETFAENEQIAALFNKYGDELKIISAANKGGAYYSPVREGISFDAGIVKKGQSHKKPYSTLSHEFGHNVDFLIAKKETSAKFIPFSAQYNNGELPKNILKDLKQIKKDIKEKYGTADQWNAYMYFKDELGDKYNSVNTTCVSDMMSSYGLRFASGHSASYWSRQRDENRATEFFAEMCEANAQGKDYIEITERFFPNATKTFYKMVDEVLAL